MSSQSETRITTRFCESDALGHISSVSYYIYIEEARVDFMKHCGLTSEVNTNWPYILVSCKCDFKNQLFIDEEIVIYTEVSNIGNSSFTITHEIRREIDNQLIAIGNSVTAYFNFETQKAEKLSDEIIAKLSSNS